MIVENVPFLDLIPLICALWRIFRREGILPEDIGVDERRLMESAVSQGLADNSGHRGTVSTRTAFANMPVELILMVAESLALQDRLCFAVAAWPCICGGSA